MNKKSIKKGFNFSVNSASHMEAQERPKEFHLPDGLDNDEAVRQLARQLADGNGLNNLAKSISDANMRAYQVAELEAKANGTKMDGPLLIEGLSLFAQGFAKIFTHVAHNVTKDGKDGDVVDVFGIGTMMSAHVLNGVYMSMISSLGVGRNAFGMALLGLMREMADDFTKMEATDPETGETTKITSLSHEFPVETVFGAITSLTEFMGLVASGTSSNGDKTAALRRLVDKLKNSRTDKISKAMAGLEDADLSTNIQAGDPGGEGLPPGSSMGVIVADSPEEMDAIMKRLMSGENPSDIAREQRDKQTGKNQTKH